MTTNLALLFPGSGAQYKGMMRSLYASSPVIRQTLDEADDILGMELSNLMMNGSTVKLSRIGIMLPAICAASVAHYRLFAEQTGRRPGFMAGHSLGEYSALICAGSLSFEEGLKLVQFRASLAEEIMETTGGGMSILNRVDSATVEQWCDHLRQAGREVSIACLNSPAQVAVSGTDDALQELEQQVTEAGGQVTYLIGSAPYHCRLMEPQVSKMAAALGRCSWRMPECTVISNVTGRPYRSVEEILKCLPQQLYRPVMWHNAVQYLQAQEAEIFVEMGPQNILKTLLADTSGSFQTYAHDEKVDRLKLAERFSEHAPELPVSKNPASLKARDKAGDEPDIRLQLISMCLNHAITSRNHHPRNGQSGDSLQMYEQVKRYRQEAKIGQLILSEEHVQEAFAMLEAVFEDKRTPADERRVRINQIRSRTGISPSKEQDVLEHEHREGMQ